MMQGPARPRRRSPLALVGPAFLILLGCAAVVLLVRSLIANPQLFLQIVIDGLQLGFVYALIALGYTMVYGIVKLINFAHGDVFMVGSFVSFYAVARFGLHRWPELAFPGFPAGPSVVIGSLTVIILAMLVCMLLAVTIERRGSRP
jgi:branched-chain amino acid transport system permease protein